MSSAHIVAALGRTDPVQLVLSRLKGARRAGTGWQARCPAHDDRTPSLSISHGDDGRALLKCHSGCSFESIVSALGVREADLFPPRTDGISSRAVECHYVYTDEAGAPLFRVVRTNPKGFYQQRADGHGGWANGVPGVRQVPFNLPAVRAKAEAGGVIYVPEGERDVNTLAAMGLVATCNAGGAGKFTADHAAYFRGARVVCLPDNDAPGRAHAETVARLCTAAGAQWVRVVELPDVPAKGDITDWCAAGGDLAALKDLVRNTPEWQPGAHVMVVEVPQPTDSREADEAGPSLVAWPSPIADAALIGLAGDAVRAIAPVSEADPSALLVQFLVGAGAMLGRTRYYAVEGDRHYPNLYTLVVGPSAGGRKGTSWGRIHRILEAADPQFVRANIKGGLSSGEGLVYHVRDARTTDEPAPDPERRGRGQRGADPGVADKRLLVLESEFAGALKVMTREGNTLSAKLRQGWDTGNIGTLTRNDPLTASDAHVAIIGHITRDELRRRLDGVELVNGFVNRFLLVAARQSQLLPHGAELDTRVVQDLGARLAAVVRGTIGPTRARYDDEAAARWAEVYGSLLDVPSGLLGAAVARGAAQVTRLATLYAALDLSQTIRLPHLEAALAVWRYAADTAAYVFGEHSGDPVAERILGALSNLPAEKREAGLSRTQIRDLFAGHKGPDIANALRDLEARGRIGMIEEPTAGRPIQRWALAQKARKAQKAPVSALIALNEPTASAQHTNGTHPAPVLAATSASEKSVLWEES